MNRTVTVDAFAPITVRDWLTAHAEATGQDPAALHAQAIREGRDLDSHI